MSSDINDMTIAISELVSTELEDAGSEGATVTDPVAAPAEPASARWSEDLEGCMRRAVASSRRVYVSRQRERAAADRAAIIAACAAACAAAEREMDAWPSLPLPDVSSLDITEWPGAAAAPSVPEELPRGVVRPVPPAAVQVALRRPRSAPKRPSDNPPSPKRGSGSGSASSGSEEDEEEEEEEEGVGGVELAPVFVGGRWAPGCPVWLLPQHPRPPPYKSWTGVKRNHLSMETGQRMFYTEADTGETVPLSDDEGAVAVAQQDARALDGLARGAADAAIAGALASAAAAGEDLGAAVGALAAVLGVSQEALARRVAVLETPLPREEPPTWAPRAADGDALDADFHGAFCRMCRAYGCHVHQGGHPRPVTGPMGAEEEAVRDRRSRAASWRRPAAERPPAQEVPCAPCGPRCYRLFLSDGERATEAARAAAAEGRLRAAQAQAAAEAAEEEGEDEEEARLGEGTTAWASEGAQPMEAEGGGAAGEGTSPRAAEPGSLAQANGAPPLDSIGAVLAAAGAASPGGAAAAERAAAERAAAERAAAERATAAAREAAAAGAPARASPPRAEGSPAATPAAAPAEASAAAAAAVAGEAARPWAPWEDAALATGLEAWGRAPCRIAALVGSRSCASVRARLAALAPSPRGGADGAPASPAAPPRRGRRKGSKSAIATRGRKKATVVQERLARSKEGAVWEQFHPCDCEGPCGPACPCAGDANFCEKFCGCDAVRCGNRFAGCQCRCGAHPGRRCSSRHCPCTAAGRECDPDLCRMCAPTLAGGAAPGHQCNNLRLRLGQKRRVLQGLSGVAGWGAFLAGPAARKDEFIGEYCGELVDQDEADRRGKVYDRDDNSYLFNLNQGWVIDARQSGNKLRFANHSAAANCRTEILMVDGDHRVAVLANRDLRPGEELFYDYRYDHMVAPDWALDGGGGGGGGARGRGGGRGRGGRGRG